METEREGESERQPNICYGISPEGEHGSARGRKCINALQFASSGDATVVESEQERAPG